jgi:hypothetical protein
VVAPNVAVVDAGAGTRRNRRDLALVAVVPVVLAVVAVVQIVRVDTLEQSSWHGSGFGMFATFENASHRLVRVTTADGERLRAADPDLVQRARVVPDDRALRDVGRSAAREAELPTGTELRIEVWGIDLDDSDGRLVLTPTLVHATAVASP